MRDKLGVLFLLAVVFASSGGWEHSRSGGELSSVWNRKQDHVFLVPEISWAEIQLYEIRSERGE